MSEPNPPAAIDEDHTPSGQLAQVMLSRGSRSTKENPFVFEHRESLIYMLREAAELEHAILCQYLFAAFSMKQRTDEGVTEDQLQMIQRWRKVVLEVAGQEMLHLALVQNLLTAIGAAPHLTRPNLPCPARHFPPGVQIALIPFGERALRHFLYLERPEGMDLEDAEGFAALDRAEPLLDEGEIVPRLQDFATVGHLYRSIEAGFAHLAEKVGQDRLFVGPPRAQATEKHFGWKELVPVTDVESARAAIETIVEQGEGSRGDWREAHFGKFHMVLDEYLEAREREPLFEPTRPVIAANVRLPEFEADVPIICNVATARVVDLFNVGYEILLQVLYRFFTHTEETDDQLVTLADVAVGIMFALIDPLGELITRLPAGPDFPGMSAGASFELFYESDFTSPHHDAAWTVMEERLCEAADFARRLARESEDIREDLDKVASAADGMAERLRTSRS